MEYPNSSRRPAKRVRATATSAAHIGQGHAIAAFHTIGIADDDIPA
jgi:hypothetical protein